MDNDRGTATSDVETILDGRYRLLSCIADSGMGAVHVAEVLETGARVAIKLSTSIPSSATSLRDEIRVLRKLEGERVVPVLDEGVTPEGEPFFVMPLLPGCDLGALLRRSGPLDHARILRILASLARVIDSVHRLGVVHGDIKPGNVFIGLDDEVTLIDFGLAVDRREETRNVPYLVLGTPEYMAPEQVLGVSGSVRASSDRYAFAAIALEMLTGQRPYPSQTIGALLLTILDSRPRLPSELGYASLGVDAIFARAMARDPDRRYARAQAFVDALAGSLVLGSENVGFRDCSMTPTVSMIPVSVDASTRRATMRTLVAESSLSL